MVLLSMTPAVARAIAAARRVADDELSALQMPDEPSLAEPAAGKPVAHGQLIALAKLLRAHADESAPQPEYTLDALLRGSGIYTAPPPPKKEPTPEYTALMKRLRRDEEARAYERMLSPRPAAETFSQRFPASPMAFQDHRDADFDEDDVSYEETHRQIILIINILVSIICCSVFIWVAARQWTAPRRLALSMSGSALVAVAEVVIYHGYVRRIKEAKLEEKKRPEIKQIIESWVIDGAAEKKNVNEDVKEKLDDGVRFRKGKHR